MAIQHKAFLDLESAVSNHLNAGWDSLWGKLGKKIEKALLAKDFLEAHDLIDTLDIVPLVESKTKYLKTMATAALFLGVSKVSPPKSSETKKNFPTETIENVVKQMKTLLGVNAQKAILIQAHLYVDKIQYSNVIEKKEEIKSEAFRFYVHKKGKEYYDTAGSLMISRMSSAGMLMESSAKGATTYTISAVLDNRVCPVCEEMSGKSFPVDDGKSFSALTLSSDDPEFLKQVAPWPKQDAKSMKALKGMSSSDLQENGLMLPPYHPLCRCIILTGVEDFVDVGHFNINESNGTLTTQQRDPQDVDKQLFGDYSDMEEDSLDYFALGAAAALLLYTQEEEEKELREIDAEIARVEELEEKRLLEWLYLDELDNDQ